MRPLKQPTPAVRNIIAAAAARHGVPVSVALAFAAVESGFDPNAAGDKDWATQHPQRYQRAVLQTLSYSPYATDKSLWHSYGLFQLNAAYHVKGKEDPRVLFDPMINADRGCRAIARFLSLTNRDPYKARLRYVGCGENCEYCDETDCTARRAQIGAALKLFGWPEDDKHAR